jgi:hypothetical protein
MNGGLGRMWKKKIVAYSNDYPGICVEELKKNVKNLNWDSY